MLAISNSEYIAKRRAALDEYHATYAKINEEWDTALHALHVKVLTSPTLKLAEMKKTIASGRRLIKAEGEAKFFVAVEKAIKEIERLDAVAKASERILGVQFYG